MERVSNGWIAVCFAVFVDYYVYSNVNYVMHLNGFCSISVEALLGGSQSVSH